MNRRNDIIDLIKVKLLIVLLFIAPALFRMIVATFSVLKNVKAIQ